MSYYEYKTIALPFSFGILKKGMPHIEKSLNEKNNGGE